MSRENTIRRVGTLGLVFGVILEEKHLAAAILRQFAGCTTFKEVAARAWGLDDVSIAGVVLCGVLIWASARSLMSEPPSDRDRSFRGPRE